MPGSPAEPPTLLGPLGHIHALTAPSQQPPEPAPTPRCSQPLGTDTAGGPGPSGAPRPLTPVKPSQPGSGGAVHRWTLVSWWEDG